MKLAFNSFKTKSQFSYKDPIPNDFKSFPVYKFTCVSCSSSYIDESYRNFKTRIEKHIKMITGLIFVKHLHSTFSCFDSYNSVCFEITEKGNSILDLKIKKSLHISWRKYNCTTKSFTSHPFTMASVPYCFCLSLFFFYYFLFFSFLFCCIFWRFPFIYHFYYH